jgi:hypothetical protein
VKAGFFVWNGNLSTSSLKKFWKYVVEFWEVESFAPLFDVKVILVRLRHIEYLFLKVDIYFQKDI